MKRLILINIVLLVWTGQSQIMELPPDFRQHTLTDYNSSFFNPVFSLDRNMPQSVALWTRWQWQNIDPDPTTIFLNYTRRLNPESAGGIAFFQHNTGIYLQRGGVFNYAQGLDLANNAQISFGLNLYAYQRELADENLIGNPGLMPPPSDSNAFILQLAPGLQFKVGGFSLGIASENLLDYNISDGHKVSDAGEKIYLGHVSYDFPITAFGSTEQSFVRPVVYLKSVPGFENQVGLNALLSTSKFWAQLGYNNYYGVSTGVGGRILKKFSIGALMEFGTSADLDGFDPTIEIVAAFYIGPQFEPKEELVPEEEELPEEKEEEITEEELAKEAELAAKQREEEERLAEAAAIAAAAELARQKEEERLAEEARKAREQFVKDSLEAAKLAEAEAARKLAELEQKEEEAEKPKAGEKYQEAAAEGGLEPGYYLVANVFGTKRYYEAFMKTLADMGIEPKSFYRTANKYNYVYLERYDTMQQARQARDSQFNGKYKGDTWIFRIVDN